MEAENPRAVGEDAPKIGFALVCRRLHEGADPGLKIDDGGSTLRRSQRLGGGAVRRGQRLGGGDLRGKVGLQPGKTAVEFGRGEDVRGTRVDRLEPGHHLVGERTGVPCGEIVLDKLLIEEIMRMNPELSVTALVRGSSEGNDATMEDAAEVGLPSVCRVVGNGAPIDATVLRYLSGEARALLRESDFIVAKGQANYESLYGSGLHVFYLLMCKCDFFTERFQVPKYSGVLTEETGRL